MVKSREQKRAVLEELKDKISRAKTVVFLIYAGLSVKEMTELRRKLEEADIDFGVYKLTLLEKAAEEKGLKIDPTIFKGPTAIAFSYKDEVAAAKIIHEFGKKYETVEIEGGIFENEVVDAAKIKTLAAIPSKEELLVKLVRATGYPMAGLISVLKGNLSKLVFVLNSCYQSKAKCSE